MMTVSQLRAARALLNVSQAELAEMGGISTTSLSAIEREAKTPRVKTMAHLQNVLEGQGVEFTEGQGVRFADQMFDIKVYPTRKGPSAEYHQEILTTLKTKGGKFCALSENDTYKDPDLRRVQFDYFRQMVRMGFQERIILPENNVECYGPKATSEYRMLKSELFGEMEISLFGDRFAINGPDRVIVVRSKSIAEAFQKQFEFYWRMAKPVPAHAPRVFDQDMQRWG